MEYAITAYEFSVFRYIPKTQIEEKLPLALRDFYKLYAVVSYALGASILYRGRFSEYLFASTGFIAAITMIDAITVAALGWMGMGDVAAGVLSGQGIYRMLVVMAIKMLDTGIVFLACRGLKRAAYRLRMSGGYAAMITCLLMGGIGGIYLVTQAESLVGIGMNPFWMLSGFSLILLICILYFFLRVRETSREQEYIARQNRILEQNYQAAKEAYETNATLYHENGGQESGHWSPSSEK